jgi:hypothetical protein
VFFVNTSSKQENRKKYIRIDDEILSWKDTHRQRDKQTAGRSKRILLFYRKFLVKPNGNGSMSSEEGEVKPPENQKEMHTNSSFPFSPQARIMPSNKKSVNVRIAEGTKRK